MQVPSTPHIEKLDERQRELVLILRARRRLLEQTLLERRTLLALAVFLALVAVIAALLGLLGATVAATLASGTNGLLLRHHACTDRLSKPNDSHTM
jgi:hypothetical protein